MFKKILIALAVVIVLLVAAVVAIPLFVDANKFKPQIVKAVEDNLNADFTIGELKLSLWGGVYFEVSKMILSEKGSGGSKPIFAMTDAKLNIPIKSIFGGKPDITLFVKKPEINVVVGLDGKMNVMKIMKPSTASKEDSAGKGVGAAAGLAFDLSFNIQEGHVAYIDQKKGTRTDLNGMNLELSQFGLNQPFKFSFKTDLNAKELKDLTLRGPVFLKGSAAIYVKSEGLERMDLDADVDMTGLLVKYADLFDKSAKVPLKSVADISATENSFSMKQVHFIANDAIVTTKGTVTNFDAPNLNIQVESGKFIFENWQEIIKPLKEFDMKGAAQLEIKVTGPLSKMAYGGKVLLRDGNLKAPGIVPRVTDLKATMNFSNDSVLLTDTGLKMGSSDMQFSGSVKNFSRPLILLNMKSALLDVDALLPEKTPEQVKAEEKAAASKTPMTDAQIEAVVAGPIYMMKKVPALRNMDMTAKVEMKKIVAHKAEIQNLEAEATFKDLAMSLRKASAQAFGGKAQFGATIDFRGSDPVYQATADMSGVDINAAVSNQMPIAKDTIFGKVAAKFTISGSGVTKAKAKQFLKGNGNFNIAKGSWTSLTAMKQISESLASLPANIRQQIGGINISDKFRQLKADFNIAGGHFNIVNMVADMEGPNTTVTGQGWVDFDMNNQIVGRILTPGNTSSLGPKSKAPDGRLSLPYEIGCKITSPCFKADALLKEVGEGLLKTEGTKAIKKALEGVDNPQVKELLKKLPF